ncbi:MULTISPECIES: hypothetical protein [unclassified Pseudoalteromonas]|uniref:hypothetical protein n=1 Tax=unclassified Pseudoalteromonas TaxID=194690 RepID=UPI00390C4EEC|nr:hypothetical protein [Ningiella sp. W23]
MKLEREDIRELALKHFEAIDLSYSLNNMPQAQVNIDEEINIITAQLTTEEITLFNKVYAEEMKLINDLFEQRAEYWTKEVSNFKFENLEGEFESKTQLGIVCYFFVLLFVVLVMFIVGVFWVEINPFVFGL